VRILLITREHLELLRPVLAGRHDLQCAVLHEDGSPCLSGEGGELVHRGVHVSLGYWNDVEKTAERFRPAPGLPMPEMAVCIVGSYFLSPMVGCTIILPLPETLVR